MLRHVVIEAARSLRSVAGENPEYDRALVELAAELLGVQEQDRDTLKNEILSA